MYTKKIFKSSLAVTLILFITLFSFGCTNITDKYKPVYKYTNEQGKEIYDWPEGAEAGMINVIGGKVNYRLYGKDKKATPLICVHGGPGGSMNCFYKQLSLAEERPVLIYNQLGSAGTEINDEYQNPEKVKTLYTIDRFVDELNTVINHFNFNNFVLYGTSWGCMLSLEYVGKYQPAGLKGIIFGGPFLNVDKWIDDAHQNLLSLENGQEMFNWVQQCDASGIYDEKYDEINTIYSTNFNNRHKGCADDRPDKNNGENFNPVAGVNVYEYMWGKSEFSCTGVLQHHDSTYILKNVNVPIIYMPGQYDEGTPQTSFWYCSLTKNGEVAVLPGAGHSACLERPVEFQTIMSEFLHRIEN